MQKLERLLKTALNVRYGERYSENSNGIYAKIVFVGNDGSERIIGGFKPRYFKTKIQAEKAVRKYFAENYLPTEDGEFYINDGVKPFNFELFKNGRKAIARNGRLVDFIGVCDKCKPCSQLLVMVEGLEEPMRLHLNGKLILNEDYEVDLVAMK